MATIHDFRMRDRKPHIDTAYDSRIRRLQLYRHTQWKKMATFKLWGITQPNKMIYVIYRKSR